MNSLKTVLMILKADGFPEKKIAQVVADSFQNDVKARDLGLKFGTASHYIDKSKHPVKTTNWSTKLRGYPVDYFYKYCPTCKRVIFQRATLFVNETNTCYQEIFLDYKGWFNEQKSRPKSHLFNC